MTTAVTKENTKKDTTESKGAKDLFSQGTYIGFTTKLAGDCGLYPSIICLKIFDNKTACQISYSAYDGYESLPEMRCGKMRVEGKFMYFDVLNENQHEEEDESLNKTWKGGDTSDIYAKINKTIAEYTEYLEGLDDTDDFLKDVEEDLKMKKTEIYTKYLKDGKEVLCCLTAPNEVVTLTRL